MRLDYNEDQTTFLTFLGQMLASSEAEFRAAEDWGRYEYGAALDARLEENGFFDAAAEEELGTVAAAAMTYEVAQKPVAIECGASSLLRPFLGREAPRPLAVVLDDAPGAIRYLPVARTLISVSDKTVRVAELTEGSVSEVESLYAYPMGTVDRKALSWSELDVASDRVRVLWRVATAAELAGVLKGALESVLAYVRERQQFGRPLGSFQAVQHRLSINAIEIEASRMLLLKAAQSLSAEDAALALGYVQKIASRVGYDFHQFMGAMGLTLEHPLHRWTYRARLLRADQGGSSSASLAYASERWGAP